MRNNTGKLLLTALLSCLLLTVTAQNCTPVFEIHYGAEGTDEALTVLHTTDKGALVGGRTTSHTAESYDAFIMKVTESGAVEWSYNYSLGGSEEITKLVAGKDGNYLAMGSVFQGNGDTIPFLVKINSTGSILWSAQYPAGSGISSVPADLQELRDGSIAYLINRNPGTANADGLLLKLNSTGGVLYSKLFDNGNEDGFQGICEQQDSLILMGHATIGNYKQAILSKINPANGNVYWSKSIWRLTENNYKIYETAGINVQAIPGGLAFSTTSYEPDVASVSITTFKMLHSGKVSFERLVATVQSIETSRAMVAPHNEFMITLQDSAGMVPAEFTLFDFAGAGRNRRYFGDWPQVTKLYGLDTSSTGFWLAGYFKAHSGDATAKIKLLKTTPVGTWGTCTGIDGSQVPDSLQHQFYDFTWQRISNPVIQKVNASLTSGRNFFTATILCSENYCEDPLPATNICLPAFHMQVKSRAQLRLFDAFPTPDGGTILAGGDEFYNSLQANVTKLRSDGSSAWSNEYGQYQAYGFARGMLDLQNGSHLVYGISEVDLDHGASFHSFVTKIDATGNNIWQKELQNISIYNAIKTPDGGMIAVANGAWGSGYVYDYLIRLSSTGDVVWKKQMMHEGASPVLRAITMEGNDVYIAADDYAIASNLKVQKFNATNGDFIWDRHIAYQVTPTSFSIQSIDVIRDTVYVSLKKFVPVGILDQKITIAVVPFTKSGQVLPGYELEAGAFKNPTHYFSWNEHHGLTISKTFDDNLVTAQLSDVDGTTKLEVIKFSPKGDLIWNKQYSNTGNYEPMRIRADSNAILICGVIAQPRQYGGNASFVMKLDNAGNITNAANTSCEATAGKLTKTPLAGFDDILPIRLTEVIDDPWLTSDDYVIETEPTFTVASIACKGVAVCNQLSITGTASVCDATLSQTYKAVRNSGCTSPVLWQYDTALAKQVGVTDSTLTLQFTGEGNTQITAIITSGCGLLQAVQVVVVQNKTSPLNLGPDLILCPGSTLRISPGNTYTSYTWQDGKTDSFYVASTPGTYNVRVGSVCGTTLTDTILIKNALVEKLIAAGDTALCAGDTIALHAAAGFTSYSWAPAYNIKAAQTAAPWVYPTTSASYTLEATTVEGCTLRDTLAVMVHQPDPLHLLADTSLCEGDSLVLHAGPGFAQYTWNTGSVNEAITITTSGTYTIKASNTYGCTSNAAFTLTNVYKKPLLNLNRNLAICRGGSITLDGGAGMAAYRWNGTMGTRYLTATATGSYPLSVTDTHGCTGNDTAIINRIIDLPANFLPADTGICSYSALTLAARQSFASYRWSTGASTPTIVASTPGQYWLQVTDANNCTGSDSITLSAIACMQGIYVPTAFTPNGDGKNDLFKPLVYTALAKYSFQVYNRFGELVFTTNDPAKGWDGRKQGKDQPAEVFVWKCSYAIPGNKPELQQGTVLLLR